MNHDLEMAFIMAESIIAYAALSVVVVMMILLGVLIGRIFEGE